MATFSILSNGNIIFEGLTGNDIIFKNFRGLEGAFNTAGSRNFNLIIRDEELAQQLAEEGFNVRIRAPRDEDEQPIHHLKVNVRYTKRDGSPVKNPPIVTVEMNGKQASLDEDVVGDLDNKLLINECDIEIRPWDNPNKEGSLVCDLKELWASVSQMGLAAKHRVDDDIEDDMPF